MVLPLTFFDLRWLKFHPTERVMFYKLIKDSSLESFLSVILPKLELSLSVVLRHYLPLAGRLTWGSQDPRPSIVVSWNDYVSLTVAESDADFYRISGKGLRPETEIRSLVPEFPLSCDSPSVLSLQVTLFPNQGFCIGIAAHHSAMDGKTVVRFIKSWAHICKHGATDLPDDLSPFLDRTIINVPASLDAKIFELLTHFSEEKDSFRSLKLLPTKEISPDVVRVTLELTLENIEKLRERAKRESTRSHLELHLSTFVVANAYLWTCLVKTRGGDVNRPVRFMYAADFRNRLDPPVPEKYFGNCVFPIGCFGYKANVFLREDGFVNMVEILSDSVRSIGSQKIETICELYIDGTKNVKLGTQSGSITGSNQFGLYGSDFGWGKPCNSEIVSIDRNEAFSTSERRDKPGGVEDLGYGQSSLNSGIKGLVFLETVWKRVLLRGYPSSKVALRGHDANVYSLFANTRKFVFDRVTTCLKTCDVIDIRKCAEIEGKLCDFIELLTEELEVSVKVQRDEITGWFSKESLRDTVKSVMHKNSEIGSLVKRNHEKLKDTLVSLGLLSGYAEKFVDELENQVYDKN
ncbi:Transferase [Arabidopsis suecica]|uniref:Transferase n=1 Tax=Arabidopsis suecica TaxID=45249 RepID=A0A8T1ZVR6_ARASU|nr:Transferase [Arabidopsis suecica]